MRKIGYCIMLLLLMVPGFYGFGQKIKGTVDSLSLTSTAAHYEPEFTFDKPVDAGSWARVMPGLHAAFGSTDQLYYRTEVPDIANENASLNVTGWKGERLNMQIIVWSTDTAQQVRVKISGLVNKQGKFIDITNFRVNMVRYVMANYPYGSKEAVCGETPYKNGFLFPDRFESFERFDLPGKTVRPIWMSLNIPADAEPGMYAGNVEVYSNNARRVLPFTVKVQRQTLPKPHDWKYRLDLWQNPWVIASYYHVKPWSAEHKALLKKHLQLYAEAGGTYITTYGVHSPWADNEYSTEEGMIEWIKKKNGSWKFDYSIFDQYVSLAMSMGIDKAITIYTPLPWGERFRYKEETTGNYIYERWVPGTDTFKNNWNVFLTDLMSHLEKKGWMNKTYIGINENAMEQTLAAVRVIKSHSKKWKITYAGNWHSELNELLDDYCFLYGNENTADETKARAAKGMTTTYYVCCNPAKPNNFLFSPPIEGRWISWYSSAHGYNGFLRWAYDAWPADPMRDARYGSWPAGDCYLVYPGGNSCIRFEKLREGIQDFEKIHILRSLAEKSPGKKKVRALLGTLDQHLKGFLSEKEFVEDQLIKNVSDGRNLLDELSDALSDK